MVKINLPVKIILDIVPLTHHHNMPPALSIFHVSIYRWLEAVSSPKEQHRTDKSFTPREVQPFSSSRCWLGFVAGVLALGVTLFSSLGWRLFVATFLGYVVIGTTAALFPVLFDWI